MRSWAATICGERERVARTLAELSCVRRVYESHANFLCVEVDDAAAAGAACLKAGAMASEVSFQIPSAIRIAIGNREDNDLVLATLRGL
jgi:histidinol-phosphate aminotransferase